MLRKQIRLRKEYLHEKEKEKTKEEPSTAKQATQVANPLNRITDSEFENVKYQDPQILVTTSRSPSGRLKQFHKELIHLFPNAISMNRGAYKLKDLFEFATKKNFSDIVIAHEHRGEPDGLIVCHLPIGPTIFFGLTNTVLRHDAEDSKDTFSQAYPHLIFHNFDESKIGKRVKTILQHLFPVPNNPDSKRIVTFAAQNDFISFRHHVYTKDDYKTVSLSEIGPRFEMRPYMIKLGNLLQTNATIEWSLKSFINTAKKNHQISND
jgi:U3 small nucleolar ribonucleoprotein protein IMP4